MDTKPSNEAKWDWIPCNYNLKREINGKTVFWNLSPSIILTNPAGSGPDPNVKLFIDTEKSLQFSNDLGWNWHKSWNLPNISVRLEIKDSPSGELFLSPKNLYSHLFAVKAVLDHKDSFHLVDIGLRGVTKIELLDGHAFFSAIKFASTSYNNEGVKFHLVLSLYIMGEDDTTPKMLNSTISPPIFVDSRKSARDSQVLLEKKMSSFVEPFLPENLEKIFIKRENKRKNDIEIQIYNDVDGLFNYLTAPNIRHKVKHPLFLSLKFSKCVKLYYNSKVILNESLEELIDFLQKQLCEDHRSKKPQAAGPTTYSNETRVFLLLFEETGDSFKTKKIIEAVEPIQSTSFGLLYSKNQLPENFIEVTNIPEMIAIYRRNFANLFSASKIRRQSNLDKDDSEEESNAKSGSESSSEEEEEINPIPKKKVKSNIESCQNLAGLENNSIIQSAGLKDPFSLLKEKNEGNLNLLSIPENKDETPEKSLETETISKAKNIETEEDKNPIEPNKPETIKKQAEINKSSLNDSLGINKPTNQQANNIPNIANIPSNFMPNVNNPNANLLSFMDTLNRGPSMPQNNQNLMNPFNNPAVLALLANSQNPLNMLNQQKNLANMLNPQPSMTNAQERELMKNMQKNNGNNMSNFGMNFNNYAILNSLLMNQGLNAPGQFNLFDGLFGNMSNQSLNIPEPTQKNTTNPIGNRPNTNNTANSGNNNNNNANWNPNINNNQNNKQANDPFLQMNLNNLMMKNQTAFQNVPNNNNNNGNNNNNNNSQSDNNYLKNLLIQALKNGNANPSQLLNIASMLGKGNENNGGIMKEEEK